MKRYSALFLLSLSFFVSYAQKNYDIDEIRAGWAQKTITGVPDGNILTLLKAFNKTWRTVPATELLAHPVSNENHEDAYAIVVDRPNGYVSAAELGDDGEDIEACVWKRSNGHKLFAVVYTRYHGFTPHPISLFYDYDAAKGTLTPEFDVPLVQFLPAYSDPSVDFVHIELPQKGKDVVVTEYITPWSMTVKSTYRWNGMQPEWASTTIENMGQMSKKFDDNNLLDEKVAFSKFALHDFDGDDNPELWLSADNEENQAIYTIRDGEIDMVASTYYKTHFSFHGDNVIGTSGSCGTGCFSAEYVVLDKSRVAHTFVDFQEWNFQKETMDHTYTLDSRELSQKAGEQWLEYVGNPKEIAPMFQLLKAAER